MLHLFCRVASNQCQPQRLKIEKAFEISTIVLAHLKNSCTLSFEFNGCTQVPSAHLNSLFHCNFPLRLPVEGSPALLEYPRIANGSASYQYAINAITSLVINSLCCRNHIPVAKNGNTHPRIVFHLTYEPPVSSTAIHLSLSASVYA